MRILIRFSLLLLFPTFVLGQPANSGSFYQPDFAQTPLESSSGQNQPRLDTPSIKTHVTEDSRPTSQTAESGDLTIAPDAESNSEVIEDRPLPEPDRPGEQVLWLGLILNTTQHQHAMNMITPMLELAEKKRVKLGNIYLVGKYGTPGLSNDEIFILSKAGGSIHFVDQIPSDYEGYNIKLSPTWIVVLKKGEILLEGIEQIRNYFNLRGEFMEPEKKPGLKASADLPAQTRGVINKAKLAAAVERIKGKLKKEENGELKEPEASELQSDLSPSSDGADKSPDPEEQD